MAMLLDGPQPPPPDPVVLEAGWDAVGGHARVVRHQCACSCAARHVQLPDTSEPIPRLCKTYCEVLVQSCSLMLAVSHIESIIVRR